MRSIEYLRLVAESAGDPGGARIADGHSSPDQRAHRSGASMSRHATRCADPTPGKWIRAATIQTMHDGTVIQTWGVQVSETGQWVGKVHPVGLTQANRAEAHANGALFAASKSMAALLTEAVEAYAGQFDATENQDISISGADFIDWFTQWRLRVRAALRVAGTLDMATITPNRRADIEALIARGRSKPHTSNKET